MTADLAKKPYDRARLDVVASAAIPGAQTLVIGAPEIADYLQSQSTSAVAGVLDDLNAVATFGGAVAYGLDIDADALESALEKLGAALVSGAPIMLTLYQDRIERERVTSMLEGSALFDRIRVEARRPYLFEAPRPQIFATARRR